MAATFDRNTPAAKQYVDYDEYVDFQIEKARAHIKATDIFTTFTTLVAAFVGYLLLFVVCDQWVFDGGFSDWARSAMLTIVVLAMGMTLIRRVILPLVRRVHPLYAAQVIEKADPNLKSNLLNFVDVQQSEGTAAAPDVLRAMQKRAAVELSHIDVDEAIDRRPLLRVAYALLAVVVVSAAYIVFSPKDPFTSVRRALLPAAPIAVATETTIAEVTPGDESVPARTHLTIEADVRGRDTDEVRILFTTTDHKEVDQPVEMRRIDPDLPRFRGVLNGENGRGLLQSLSYAITAGDARTRDFHIEVIQPPSARIDDVHCVFPAYMQFDERTTAGGGIDGWEGATVTVRATANMPVKSATIVMTDNEDAHAKGEEIAMQVSDGTKLSAKWKLEFRSDGTSPHFYYVQVKTAKGEIDPEPTVHPLRIRPDQRPDVALIAPAGDLVGERARPANAIIPLVVQASDPDFLLRSIRLKAERNGEEIVNEPLFDNRDLGQSFRGSHDWSLGALKPNLRPGETIQFWIEVRDNKQPTANRAVTPRVNLEIRPEKSADDVRKDLAAEKQEQEDQLARAEETKTEGGNDPLPRQENDDTADETPPERPNADERPARDPSSPKEDEPSKDEPTRNEKSEPNAGETRNTQSQPPGDNPEKALERLLQKQDDMDQPKPNDLPNERPDEAQPPEKKKTEVGEKSGNKSEAGTKKGSAKSGDNVGRSGDSDQQKSETKEGSNADKARPQPDSNAQKKPGDSSTEKSKNSGDAKSKTDKAGSDDLGESKDQPSPERAKPGDDSKKSGDRKSSTKRSEESQAGEKKTAEDQVDKKTSGGKDGEEKGTDEASSADETGKKPEKSPDAATDDQPQSDPKKTPDQGQQPGSDGAGDEESPTQGAESDKGKQAKSPSKTDAEKPGDASDPDTNPDSKTPAGEKKSESTDSESEQEPADDSAGAKKRKADGTEPNEATGSDEDDPDAVKKNDVKRKPDSKAGKIKPSESKDADPNRPRERRKSEAGNDSATDNAKEAKRAPDGKAPTEQPGKTDEPASEKPETSSNADTPKQPGEPPDAGNPKQQGEGRKVGQKSEQPQGGERGKSAASDQGESGGNKEGPGDKSDQSGDSEQSEGKTGNAGKKPGEGSSSKPSAKGSESKAGDRGKSGKDGGGEGKSPPSGGNGESGKSGSPSAGKPGSSSQPGSQAGGQSPSPVGGGVNGPASSDGTLNDSSDGEGEGTGRSGTGGEGVPSSEEEEARLDYAKKASNLLLQRLKDQLARGEVDQKLLDEMGWKDVADVTKFTQYLEGNLKNTGDETKRLQFEELLKSMRLGKETIHRKGGEGPERRFEKTGSRTAPVPPEYREQYEAYTKRINKSRRLDDAKAAPAGRK